VKKKKMALWMVFEKLKKYHILRNIIYELLKKFRVVADQPVWQRSYVQWSMS